MILCCSVFLVQYTAKLAWARAALHSRLFRTLSEVRIASDLRAETGLHQMHSENAVRRCLFSAVRVINTRNRSNNPRSS